MFRLRAGSVWMALAVALTACAADTDPQTTTATSTTTAAPDEPTIPSTLPPIQTTPLMTLPPGASVCDAYPDVIQEGALSDQNLPEVSGLAASRRHEGVLWVHNDSRGGSKIYALSTKGLLLATWELDGAASLDWEDVSAGPGPESGTSYLYVGDIGDNFSLRPEISVFRFPEPDVTSDGVVEDVERFRLKYPDGRPNAEALAVDPVTGDVFVITKDRGGPAVVFVARADQMRPGLTTELEEVARLELGRRAEVTAADFSPAGERIAMRGYEQVWIWPRVSGDLADTFQRDPCRAASPKETQGEALGFSADGLSLFTISEGTGAAVNRIAVAP